MATKLTDKELNELKQQVLIDRLDYLSAELGDPGRYYPALRAKGVLSHEDCERIKAKVTSREKVHEMIELIRTRQSEKDGHAMDVLMEALRKQRVQAHIAGELQRALARAKEQKKGVASKSDAGSPMVASPLNTPSTTPSHIQTPSSILATPTPRLTTPSNSAVHSLGSTTQYEMHAQYGALPPNCPRKPTRSPSGQSSPAVDPRYGQLPGTPPPRTGTFHPTQDGAGPGMGEVATGMSSLSSNVMGSMNTSSSFSHYYNGGSELPSGQSLDRRNSELSYTTTSGTMYSTTSTEQSVLEYGGAQGEYREHTRGQGEYREHTRGQGEYRENVAAQRDMEVNVEQGQSWTEENLEELLMKKDHEISQLQKENRRLTDKYQDLDKQYAQMCEKVRQNSISDQRQMLDSYKLGKKEDGVSDEVVQLHKQMMDKDRQIAMLQSQVEHYQQENQQLQLSLSSTNSSRPQHLPIGNQIRAPAIQRPSYTPSRSPYHGGLGDTPAPVGGTPGAGITPMRSVRVGDNLNQHNIHLQQPWGASSRRESPAYSPGKEPATKGPPVFSPGREGMVKGGLFSPGREGSGKRLSGSSGETPMGESYFKSSSSSLNSSESKGSAGITLQTAPNAEHSTMV